MPKPTEFTTAQYVDERVTMMAIEIQEQIRFLIQDGEMPENSPDDASAAQILAGECVSLERLALVAKRLLAWDSEGFLAALDVSHRGGVHAVPTSRGWTRLATLGMPRTFNFADWDS